MKMILQEQEIIILCIQTKPDKYFFEEILIFNAASS